jgi:nucleotide-binding universal stress UspA family protein
MADDLANPNFDRIVVGVDGSNGSTRALQWAQIMASITGAEVLAVHAVEYIPLRGHETNELVLEQHSAELDGHWTAALRTNGTRYRTIIEIEDPRVLLERVALDEHADVIVVGSHGHSRIADLMLGSVAEYLTHRAKLPVVIIPAGAAISSP